VLAIERDRPTGTARTLTLMTPRALQLRQFIAQQLPGWLQGLQRLLPATPLLQDLELHPFNGVTAYRSGNGVATVKAFDAAGRLTALSATGRQGPLLAASYGYGVGPRIRRLQAQRGDGVAPSTTDYRYDGFGALQREAGAHAAVLRTRLQGERHDEPR